MDDRSSPLYATRIGLVASAERRIGALAAAQAAAYAVCDFFLLLVWKGSGLQRSRGNFLRASAYGGRGRAFLDGAGTKIARPIRCSQQLRAALTSIHLSLRYVSLTRDN